MYNYFLSLILGCLFFVGCAISPQRSHIVIKDYSADLTVANLSVEDLDIIEKQLQEVSKFAQSQGGESVQLLVDDLFIKGNDAALREQHELAELFFHYAIKLNPDDRYLQEKYIVELVKNGKLKVAKEELIELLKVKDSAKNKKRWRMILAGIHSALEEYPEAIKLYKTLLSYEPGEQTVCLSLNGIYITKEEYGKAERLLKNCLKSNRDEDERLVLNYQRAKNFALQKKFTSSIKILRRILKKRPAFKEGWLTLGLLFEEQKKFKQAVRTYKVATEKGGDDYLILSRLTNILMVQDQVKEATDYLQRLVDLNPDNLASLIKLGIAYSDIKEYTKSKQIFEQILHKVPDSDKVLYYLGVLSIEMNELEDAFEFFARIQEDSSFYLDAHLQLAMVSRALYEQGVKDFQDKMEIVKLFEQFLDIGKDNAEYQMQMVLKLVGFLDSIGEINRAISWLERVKSDPLFTVDHSYYLAALYEKIGKKEIARNLMLDIIKQDPKNAQAYNFYGYSLLEEGKEIAKAFQYIRKAVELNPKDAYIRDSLGWYYFVTKKYKKALAELRVAHKLLNSEPTILQHLAQVYQKLNDHQRAHKFYTEALKSSTTQSDRDFIKKQLEVLDSVIKQSRIPASN